jgi:Type II secretion system (T2SS), protein E, N-terminal domain
VLEHTLSEDEHNQIVQTIEMFEAITQTQPDDCGSLEILKEAYGKIGKHDDSLRVSRRLAEAYFGAGSYTLAMQECEVLLIKEPNAPDILAMLGDIEARLQASGKAIATASGAATGLIDKANTSIGDGSLIDIGSRNGDSGKQPNLNDRGDDHLAKFLIVQQLFSEEEVSAGLLSVQQFNKDLSGQALAVSLLDHLCKDNVDRLETVLSALIDRTKFAYVPLEYYDLDRQIAPMLPEHLTLGRMFVPFDLVSRTMMVACCNPFDSAGREAVQQSVDYTVTWYLARPVALIKSLQSIYRLDSRA